MTPIVVAREPLLAQLVDFPFTSPLPPRLYGVVNDLHRRKAEIVTLADLARYDTGDSPQALAKALRRRGWLQPLRTRGAWAVPFVWSWHFGPFVELRGRLAVRPDTPACIGGISVADVRSYLDRPVQAMIGVPPGAKVPRCLDGYPVCRWAPQVPLDEIGGLPVWKNETLLAYMAAKPAGMSWENIADWLHIMCRRLDAALLLAELAGRPRAVWMKVGFLAKAGGREDVADSVLAAAPAGAGPYVFGHRFVRRKMFAYPPRLAPKFEVMDYVLATWWLPKWGRVLP